MVFCGAKKVFICRSALRGYERRSRERSGGTPRSFEVKMAQIYKTIRERTHGAFPLGSPDGDRVDLWNG